MKKRWGVLAYGATALQVLWQTRPFRAEIRFNGTSVKGRTVQIAVGNGRYYGGGTPISQDATIDDHQLDLYSLEVQYWWQMIPILPAMSRGRQATWPSVVAHQSQAIEVVTHHPRPISTDGEITTQTPAHFQVVPQALSVIVPAEPDTPGLSNS